MSSFRAIAGTLRNRVGRSIRRWSIRLLLLAMVPAAARMAWVHYQTPQEDAWAFASMRLANAVRPNWNPDFANYDEFKRYAHRRAWEPRYLGTEVFAGISHGPHLELRRRIALSFVNRDLLPADRIRLYRWLLDDDGSVRQLLGWYGYIEEMELAPSGLWRVKLVLAPYIDDGHNRYQYTRSRAREQWLFNARTGQLAFVSAELIAR